MSDLRRAVALAASLLVFAPPPGAANPDPVEPAKKPRRAIEAARWIDCDGVTTASLDCDVRAPYLKIGEFDRDSEPELAACAVEWWHHDSGSGGDAGTLAGDARLIRFALVMRQQPVPDDFLPPAVGQSNLGGLAIGEESTGGPRRNIYRTGNLMASVHLHEGKGHVIVLVLPPETSTADAADCHALFERRNKSVIGRYKRTIGLLPAGDF